MVTHVACLGGKIAEYVEIACGKRVCGVTASLRDPDLRRTRIVETTLIVLDNGATKR